MRARYMSKGREARSPSEDNPAQSGLERMTETTPAQENPEPTSHFGRIGASRQRYFSRTEENRPSYSGRSRNAGIWSEIAAMPPEEQQRYMRDVVTPHFERMKAVQAACRARENEPLFGPDGRPIPWWKRLYNALF